MHRLSRFPTWNKISTFTEKLLCFLSRLKYLWNNFPTLWQADFQIPKLQNTGDTKQIMIDSENYKSEKSMSPNNFKISLPLGTWDMWESVFSKQIYQNYYKLSSRCHHVGMDPLALGDVHIWSGSCYSFCLGTHFIKLSKGKWHLHSKSFHWSLSAEVWNRELFGPNFLTKSSEWFDKSLSHKSQTHPLPT